LAASFKRLVRCGAKDPANRGVTAAGVSWKPQVRQEQLMNQASKPLAGVRILDLTHMLSGPYGSMILADLRSTFIYFLLFLMLII